MARFHANSTRSGNKITKSGNEISLNLRSLQDSAGSIQELFGFKPNMVDMDDELELITTRIDAILGVSKQEKKST